MTSTVGISSVGLERQIDQCVANGHYSSAVPLLECLLRLTDDAPEHLLKLANCLYESGQFDTSLQTCRRAIEKISLHGTGSVGSGADQHKRSSNYEKKATVLAMRCCIARQDPAQSITYAEQVLATSPDDVEAMCVLGQCAYANGNTPHATRRYRDALHLDPLCIKAFDALCNNYLLSRMDLQQLVCELRFPAGTEAMREVYLTRAGADQPVAATSAAVPKQSILLRQALHDYRNRDLHSALHKTTQLFDQAPFEIDGTTLHLAVLNERHETTRLYEAAHRLAAERANSSLTYYAIGCYYFCQHSYERAGRFFCRATEVEPQLPAAHIALGHCYARLEEGEAAMGVYRGAQHSFPGLHLGNLYVGVQYGRLQNWTLAMASVESAKKICPNDPFVLNEAGVILFKSGRFQKALQYFLQAIECLPSRTSPGEYLDGVYFNVGTAYRKLRDYEKAIQFYTEYIRHCPNSPQGHTALGLTNHLTSNVRTAIHHYHVALSLKNDIFCRDLLERALAEEYSRDVGGMSWGDTSPALQQLSPSPANAFSTIGRTMGARSESCPGQHSDPTPSPHPIVGRSLF